MLCTGFLYSCPGKLEVFLQPSQPPLGGTRGRIGEVDELEVILYPHFTPFLCFLKKCLVLIIIL